ncbi:MAG: VCBS repeat-containing protein [Planctomycetes bacterium]|nr:VCBS repeat-containing protein [Planctomycetota bacterium]
MSRPFLTTILLTLGACGGAEWTAQNLPDPVQTDPPALFPLETGNYARLGSRALPVDRSGGQLADLDGDGLADYTVDGRLYRNRGAGRFWPDTGGAVPRPPFELVDVDQDGDLDAFQHDPASEPTSLHLWRNRGDGRFTFDRTLGDCLDFAVVDVDGDDAPDVYLVGTTDAVKHRMLRNHGSLFVDETETWLAPLPTMPRQVEHGDFDRDARPEFVVRLDDLLLHFESNGTRLVERARFTDSIESVTAVDWEIGGYIDLVVDDQVWVGGPDGFSPLGDRTVPANRFIDLDGDGDDDGIDNRPDRPVFWLRNDGGSPQVLPFDGLPPNLARGHELQFGDIDGDGDLDVLAQANDGRGRDSLLVNLGGGRFEALDPLSFLTTSTNLVHADLDGDGDVDLVDGSHAVVMRNDGRGEFFAESLPIEHTDRWIAVADLDGNGMLDIVGSSESSSGGFAVLQTNDANWIISGAAWNVANLAHSDHGVLTDIDGDGDHDLIATSGGALGLWTNEGAFFLDASARMPRFAAIVAGLHVGDADADGDTDLFVHYDLVADDRTDGRIILLENDGEGNFTRQDLVSGVGISEIELVDVGADGDVDVLWSERSAGGGGTTAWIERRAEDYATPRTLTPDASDAFVIADFDADGDDDVALRTNGRTPLVFENRDLDLVAAAASWTPPNVPWTGRASLVDLDRDGDREFVAGGTILWSLERHVSIPRLPSLSRGLELQIYARDGDTVKMLPFVQLGEPDEPWLTESGWWHLGLGAIAMSEVPTSIGGTTATATFADDPTLLGLRLTIQAIAFGSAERTTNAVSATIVD